MSEKKKEKLKILYCDNVPKKLKQGVLYISEKYSTAIHLCACGCGNQVVTPISPAGWTLATAGKDMVTLRPSIGNWYFPCKSHYYITDNKVEWL